MSDTSRISHDNAVFEEPDGAAALGRPSPADAIPEPGDPRLTGEEAFGEDEDVDETLAGGLRDRNGLPGA